MHGQWFLIFSLHCVFITITVVTHYGDTQLENLYNEITLECTTSFRNILWCIYTYVKYDFF